MTSDLNGANSANPDTTPPLADTTVEQMTAELMSLRHRLLPRVEARIGSQARAVMCGEDAFQEAIAARLALASRQANDEESLSLWLARIVEGRLIDALRREGRAKRGGKLRRRKNEAHRSAHVVCPRPTAAEVLLHGEEKAALHRAMGELSEAQRMVITLYYLDGAPLKDVAPRMAKSIPAVNGLRLRGVRALRQMMTEWYGTDRN